LVLLYRRGQMIQKRTDEMLSISSCERLIAGASRLASILMLLALVMVPDQLAAQGLPVETGSQFPVALWFIGAGVLGLAIAYGIMRNRGRTRSDKQITEQATKNNYAREKRDRISTG
jgi:hypothetical protein